MEKQSDIQSLIIQSSAEKYCFKKIFKEFSTPNVQDTQVKLFTQCKNEYLSLIDHFNAKSNE